MLFASLMQGMVRVVCVVHRHIMKLHPLVVGNLLTCHKVISLASITLVQIEQRSNTWIGRGWIELWLACVLDCKEPALPPK